MSFSFINPYNFIPLGKSAHEKNLPWQSGNSNEGSSSAPKMTGKIEYTLTTLAPLFIPNTSNDRVFSNSDKLMDSSTEDTPVYHKSFEFYSYCNLAGQKDRDLDDRSANYTPVIPGSEIRGAVRSAYEALTDSCLSAIDLDAVLSKRTPEYFTSGILEWDESGEEGGWNLYRVTNKTDYLYRADHRDDFCVKTFQNMNIQDGVEVTFIKDTVYAPNRDRNAPNAKPLADDVRLKSSSSPLLRGRYSGYLVKGEAGPDLGKPPRPKCDDCPSKTKIRCKNEGAVHCYLAEKHCAHIFVKTKQVYRKFDSAHVDIYKQQISQILKIYKDNKKSPYSEYAKTWKEFINPDKDSRRKGIPVYFSEIDNGQFFFSPACVTREVYLNKLKDIIGNYAPCSGTTGCVCPACRLFGTIHNGLHIRSRLRFSDLHLERHSAADDPSAVFMQVVTLPELSTPKITSTEFYLQKPTVENLLNWTYDYYITLNGTRTNLVAYTPVISGRKFYWHSNSAEKTVFSQQDTIEVNERNKTVRPVKDHVRFQGTVFFDDISEKELQEIIAILNMSSFGQEDDYAIKLGAAKPLGFGSAALRINSVKLRTVKKDAHSIVYQKDAPYDFLQYNLSLFRRDEIIQAFNTKALKDLEKSGIVAAYPKTRPEDEGFDWFMANRYAAKDTDKTGKAIDIGTSVRGPRYRWQIAYKQYMQPLHPKLVNNPVFVTPTRRDHNKSDTGVHRSRDVSSGSSFYPRGAALQETTKRGTYTIGEIIEGKVVEHKANNQGKYMFAVVGANGNNIRVHIRCFKPHIFGDIREIVPIGTYVKLLYRGKDSKGYDDWECRIN